MIANTDSIGVHGPTKKPSLMRVRVIAGIVFLALAGISVVCAYLASTSAYNSVLPDAWDFTPVERVIKPLPTHEAAGVTVMLMSEDVQKFRNFLAHDVARHGGYKPSAYRRYVVPIWYYEELRSLELEQSAYADFDASTYVDWTAKMSGIPDRTDPDNLVRINVDVDKRISLLSWRPSSSWIVLPFWLIMPFSFIAAIVAVTYVFSPEQYALTSRRQQETD